MTINAPANILWGMYLLAATASHVPFARLGGTTQNDILKEYIAQKEFLYPPRHALRLVTDTIEFGTRSTPRWNPVSISGYHIREAGSTAVQELAFTLADGRTYVAEAKKRGLDVDEFAQRLSFFFNSHNDFFEEIAKFRAARRIWAQVMRDEFGAKSERSMWLRFHTQTAGCSCTAQQPELNIVRTTIQALAGVLGGTQSLHTNSYDVGDPAPERGRRPHRPAHAADPRERVRDRGVGRPVRGELFRRVAHRHDGRGDASLLRPDRCARRSRRRGFERGFFQREIQESSFRYQRAVEAGEEKVVGVNAHTVDTPVKVPRLEDHGGGATGPRAVGSWALRSRRDASRHAAGLDRLRKVAATEEKNTMPAVLEALQANATVGEIVHAFQDVFGTVPRTVDVPARRERSRRGEP